jgi:hypothetical protein
MNLLRGLLFENFGFKLVAMLLALLVYFNARTDRPVTLTVSFPLVLQDLPDSLSIASPVPEALQAEIHGVGKRVIQLRLEPPPVVISLAGVARGHFERSLSVADLPLKPGLEAEGLLGPRLLALEIERRMRRRLPVAARLEWTPSSAAGRGGAVRLEPATVTVSGPASAVAKLDSVRLAVLRVDGRRDTVRATVGAGSLPERCSIEPPAVRVTVVPGRARS